MLGILLGGVVGWLLRIWLAPCQETDCFLVAVWALLGAVAGGVVGAITGAALGSRRGAARADPTDTQE
jgi:hypothetical protein